MDQRLVSWRPTTVKWRQYNRHSTIITWQTEYHEVLPSLANVLSHITSSFAYDGNASQSVCLVPMVEWRLDCHHSDGHRPLWYRPQVTSSAAQPAWLPSAKCSKHDLIASAVKLNIYLLCYRLTISYIRTSISMTTIFITKRDVPEVKCYSQVKFMWHGPCMPLSCPCKPLSE